jgi:hypothetical protein
MKSQDEYIRKRGLNWKYIETLTPKQIKRFEKKYGIRKKKK